mgnify:CR=1 FL=1
MSNPESEIKFDLRQSIIDALGVAAEEAEVGVATYIEHVLVTHIREIRFKKDFTNFTVASAPPEPTLANHVPPHSAEHRRPAV